MLRDSLYFFYHTLNVVSPESSSSARKSLSAMLHDYDTPGVLPPSARIDHTLKSRGRYPWKIWDAWKYPAFAVRKASSLARDIVSYHIWGPRRRTWGIEMTILSSLMRDVSRDSALADIAMVRMVMGLAGLVPLPTDALVTPVTFRVHKRNLRGILQPLDAQETGERELSGEWIVGKKLWQALQSDYRSANRPIDEDASLEPSVYSDGSSFRRRHSRVILYIHGGAYCYSSAAAQRMISIPLSKFTDTRVFAVDYRLAPETVFPGPLHDVVNAYMRLRDDLQVPPENVVVAGDSAGGGLCLALLLYLRDNGYALPGGAILLSPWVDLTLSCASWETNAAYDIVPFPGPGTHLHPVLMYLGDGLPQYLTHPYASPLFGNFEGLPPMLIQCGEAEVLRDEIELLAHKASLAGVYVQHEIYEDAVHVFQSFPFVGLVDEAFASCRGFVRYRLPELQDSPKLLGNVCEARLGDDIDNENVRVVRGDGTEACAGRHGVQEQMESQLYDIDPELSSWTSNQTGCDAVTHDTDTGTSSCAEVDDVNTPSSLRRIKSTLSALVSEPSLLTMTEGPRSCTSPHIGKIRSSSSITSFMEQLTFSSNNCIMPPQAQLNHTFSSVGRFNQGHVYYSASP
ncbi:Alpha/Beta hydrolase protein [Scleroderma citrinum]